MCRAIIQICSSDENFYIYRSKDGYPECCGLEFLAVTKKYESNCNAKQIATDMANLPNCEAVACERGDESYKYVLDCETGVISTFVNLNDNLGGWVNMCGRYRRY